MDRAIIELDGGGLSQPAVIKVIGVGGSGGNAVNTMIEAGFDDVEFIAVNTDVQALGQSLAKTKLQIGQKITRGLGAGADPEKGKASGLEDREKISEVLKGADMVFITAGMGGGTGTGAAPVVAAVAKELEILTVAVVTKPFSFEGLRKMRVAENGVRELYNVVDTLIVIPNQKLISITDKNTTFDNGFKMVDFVLLNAVQGISELVVQDGRVNLDFADVRSIMSERGKAMMGTGIASGENRSSEAATKAINSPLLEDISIQGAKGLLINITAGPNLRLHEVDEACSLIQKEVHEEANIIFGTVINEKMGEEIRVTVIATGFNDGQQQLMRKISTSKLNQQSAATTRQERHFPEEDNQIAARQAKGMNLEDWPTTAELKGHDEDDVNVPAFLRKKSSHLPN